MPDGLIDEHRTTENARAVKPSAILYSGESWLGSTTLRPEQAARLPLDDMPAPSEQPDRLKAIVTRAIARTADGELVRADRAHLIVRKETGVQLKPLAVFPDDGRTDGLNALLAALIIQAARR